MNLNKSHKETIQYLPEYLTKSDIVNSIDILIIYIKPRNSSLFLNFKKKYSFRKIHYNIL